MVERSPKIEEFRSLRQQLSLYDAAYRNVKGLALAQTYSFIDGSERNISDARWLIQEGFDAHFDAMLLDRTIPLVVLNCLVSTESFYWVMCQDRTAVWQYAARHQSLKRAVVDIHLGTGMWLSDRNAIEESEPWMIALESYDDILQALSYNRIFGEQ